MRDYIRGTIVAGAIGDAFGMPCEGLTRAEIARHYGTVTSYRDSLYSRHTKGMKRGEYTDDAQLTLATVESIVEKRTVDIEDIGRRFTDLYKDWPAPVPGTTPNDSHPALLGKGAGTASGAGGL